MNIYLEIKEIDLNDKKTFVSIIHFSVKSVKIIENTKKLFFVNNHTTDLKNGKFLIKLASLAIFMAVEDQLC